MKLKNALCIIFELDIQFSLRRIQSCAYKQNIVIVCFSLHPEYWSLKTILPWFSSVVWKSMVDIVSVVLLDPEKSWYSVTVTVDSSSTVKVN